MEAQPATRPPSRGQPGAILRTPRVGNTSSLRELSSDTVKVPPISSSQASMSTANATRPIASPVEERLSKGLGAPASAADRPTHVNVFQEVRNLGGSQAQSASISDALANISPKELEEIRQMRKPAPVVRRTIEVVCLILDAHKNPAPSAPPPWAKVQRILEQDFVMRVSTFDLEILRTSPKLSKYLVMEYFDGGATDDTGVSRSRAAVKHERLTYQRVLRASSAAAALFRWCCMLLDVAEEDADAPMPAEGMTMEAMLAADADAPVVTSFSTCPAEHFVGQKIDDNFPIIEGGLITEYSVSPELPEGLLLNPKTGVISGTPAAASTGTFVIAAVGPGGVDTFSLQISISSPAAPSLTSYSNCPAKYIVNQGISSNCPINDGGPTTSYSVSPPLPRGLVLNSATGVICGWPEEESEGTFSITATGPGGADTFPLSITVVEDDEAELHIFLSDAKACRWDQAYRWLKGRPHFVNMRAKERRFCAIHHAAYVGSLEAIKRIIYDYGGDPLVLTSDGFTAREIAEFRDCKEVAEFMATFKK